MSEFTVEDLTPEQRETFDCLVDWVGCEEWQKLYEHWNHSKWPFQQVFGEDRDGRVIEQDRDCMCSSQAAFAGGMYAHLLPVDGVLRFIKDYPLIVNMELIRAGSPYEGGDKVRAALVEDCEAIFLEFARATRDWRAQL